MHDRPTTVPSSRPRRGRVFLACALGGALAVAAAVLAARPASATCVSTGGGTCSAVSSSLICPQTSSPTSWTGTTLDLGTSKNGVVYNGGSARLELRTTGANFKATSLSIASSVVYACVGDFNRDGWTDFAGTPDLTSTDYLRIFQNYTWQNENCTTSACTAYTSAGAPAWSNVNTVITPKFVQKQDLHGGGAGRAGGRYSLAAGDFNGDGWDDIFEGYAAQSSLTLNSFTMHLNLASNNAAGEAQFRSPYSAYTGSLGYQAWGTTNTKAVDYNNDGRLDVLIGINALGGSIRILLNACTIASGATRNADGLFPCSNNPTFTDGGYLITWLGTTTGTSGGATNGGFGTDVSGGQPAFNYVDIDADGLRDLIVGAPNCCTSASQRLRIFKGCAAGTGCSAGKLENVASQYLAGFPGAATVALTADYSLDGMLDVVSGTDNWNYNAGWGGQAFYWEHKGGAAPFPQATPQQLTTHGTGAGQSIDYDIGFVLDYDHDPARSPDMVLADGNHTGNYYVLSDRQSTTYVPCGDVYSDIIDLGALGNSEMVVTSARITPNFQTNGGTVTFYMSNEDPPNWVQAALCSGSTTDYCVNFPKPVGNKVRWKATLCSGYSNTTTPVLNGITAKFDYTRAAEHYRAGIITNDGVAYVGAFHQPGDRGRFYAVNAGLFTLYWDGGEQLDARADSTRKIYTSLASMPVRYEFSTASTSDPLFRGLLTAADQASANALVSWVRGARFGVGNDGIPLSRLGSIQNSTPAILTKPGRPNWYSYGSTLDRTRIDQFIGANATRVPLVLFGSKDGMVHAIRTLPTDINNTLNGDEAWAYVPPSIAGRMLADYTATAAANAAATDGVNRIVATAFPDGSPTLVDFDAGGGVYKTAAVVAEGAGGRAFSVFDVTQTVDPATGTVLGPTPMWAATPGNGDAGQAFAKPAIGRVLIGGVARTVVVAGTGVDFTDTTGTKGRVVAGYDLTSGTALWQFQAACPITSDVSLFETDDALEPGAPTLNGFVDRAIFADACGNVYKVNPGQDLAGGFMDNAGMGSFLVGTHASGAKSYALFSTTSTTGALGAQRPIGGTIASRTDATTRMVLFFGTGGLENAPTTQTNAFYAIYADNGVIRSKYTGACTGGACEKFYGGTLVTPSEVIFTRTYDPPVSSGTCNTGSTVVQAMQLNAASGAGTNFTQDFAVTVTSAVVGALFGDGGALYFATLAGDVGRIGAPRATNAGGDTTAGYTQGMGVGDQATGAATVGTTAPLTMMGWRFVL